MPIRERIICRSRFPCFDERLEAIGRIYVAEIHTVSPELTKQRVPVFSRAVSQHHDPEPRNGKRWSRERRIKLVNVLLGSLAKFVRLMSGP